MSLFQTLRDSFNRARAKREQEKQFKLVKAIFALDERIKAISIQQDEVELVLYSGERMAMQEFKEGSRVKTLLQEAAQNWSNIWIARKPIEGYPEREEI